MYVDERRRIMPKEKYDAIYRDLREKITDETYAYGEFLPSENQMTALYSCSRNTVRRALGQLTQEGYIQPQHGRGVRVIYSKASPAEFTIGGIESFAETAARNHLNVQTHVEAITDLVVDERMMKRTGFPVGSDVIYVRRIRLLDGVAAILDTSVFLREVTGSISEKTAAASIYSYLEGDVGIKITTGRRCITAERATQADTRFLDLADYDFVSVVTSQIFDQKGRMFEYNQSRHRPDYFAFYDTAVRRA